MKYDNLHKLKKLYRLIVYVSHSTEYIESQRCFNKYVRETFRKALHSVKKHTSQPEKILNVGVGPGGNLALFSNIFSETTMHCIDSSKPHIEAAKELHLPLLNLKFYQQNIENELALNTAYNLIWISDVFYPDCVKNPARVLRKLKNFLKPKGRIAIYYNNWTRTKFLPGYPGLESKIHGAILDQYEGEWNGPNNHENMHRWLKQSGYTIVQRKFYSTITASKQEGIYST